MPRSIAILLILLALIVGSLFLLSRNAGETPVRTVEVDVTPAGNAN